MEQATVTTNRRLQRGDGPLGGVAAGMADYFGIDPTIVRLGLVATTLLGGPTVPIVYVAAWLIIPAAEEAAAPAAPAPSWVGAPPPPPAPGTGAAASAPAPTPTTGPTAPSVAVATVEAPDDTESVDTVDDTDREADDDRATEEGDER